MWVWKLAARERLFSKIAAYVSANDLDLIKEALSCHKSWRQKLAGGIVFDDRLLDALRVSTDMRASSIQFSVTLCHCLSY